MKKTSAAQELNGYQLLELLGVGGAGSVYMAKQVSTGQLVALKRLHANPKQDAFQRQRYVARFERETQLCALLHHPNIVRLLDQGQSSEHELFAVFEFVPGSNLKDWLLSKGPMSPQNALHVMTQVLDALACAHAMGIIHRDLKPQNIMLSPIGTGLHAKVLDFGIATLMPRAHASEPDQKSLVQEAIGTPSYSAPEQLRGEAASPGTDLYAWGLLLLECLTGKAVVQGATLAEIFHKQLSAQEITLPPALEHHPLGIVLHRVLQKNNRERASDAQALLKQLQMIQVDNLDGNLVGNLTPTTENAHATPLLQPQITLDDFPCAPGNEQKQITVLCCNLAVTPMSEFNFELAALEALQHDQLNLCSSYCQRNGAFLAGALGDSLMFFYGFPHVQADDAQCAARTALELINQVQHRSRLLQRQQGVSLAISITLHSGPVLARSGVPPHGLTPDIALRLNRIAQEGSILVSSATQCLLAADFELHNVGTHCHPGGNRPVYCLMGEYGNELARHSWLYHHNTPMTGRKQPWEMLQSAWQMALAGHGGSRLIVAEAGLGKSRLVYEHSQKIQQAGYISRYYRCLPEHKNDALYPFLQLIKHYLQMYDGHDGHDANNANNINDITDINNINNTNDARHSIQLLQHALVKADCDLEHALPVLCSWLCLPLSVRMNPVSCSSTRQKKILLLALQKLIFHMAAEQTCLLILEDIHWIDQTSFELLTRLMKDVPQHPMLLLITSSPEFVRRWNPPFAQTIKLGTLSRTESMELITRLIRQHHPDHGDTPIHPASLHYLLERIDGIPLFAEELIASMLAQNSLYADGQYWYVRQDDSTLHAAIPATLQSLLTARLEHLGSARETAQIAAAIGGEFSHSLLMNASLSDETRVQTALDHMLAARLIVRQRKVEGDRYQFRHALIRDAAYASIPLNLRALVHARIGLALENQTRRQIETHLAQLAQHFALAGDYSKAIDYGQRVIQQAKQRGLDSQRHAKQVQRWQEEYAAKQMAQPGSPPGLFQALQLIHGWNQMDESPLVDTPGKNRGNPCCLLESLHSIEQATPLQWAMATYHHVATNRTSVGELIDQLLMLSKQSNDVGLLKF